MAISPLHYMRVTLTIGTTLVQLSQGVIRYPPSGLIWPPCLRV